MIPTLWLERLLNVVLSPALWLSVALAATYSVLFALLRGGGWSQVPRDLAAGLLGFGAGHLIGTLLRWQWLRVGDVQLLWGTLGATGALLVGRRYLRHPGRMPGPPPPR